MAEVFHQLISVGEWFTIETCSTTWIDKWGVVSVPGRGQWQWAINSTYVWCALIGVPNLDVHRRVTSIDDRQITEFKMFSHTPGPDVNVPKEEE